jgi:pyruvate formate lyase activating enzyme
MYYEKSADNSVICRLCPHNCLINDGATGICGVRKNRKSMLISECYGVVSAIHNDPIEKKPLYHYYPGRDILSVGGIGCNLKCSFCQNWEISQEATKYIDSYKVHSVEEIIGEAIKIPSSIGIAYTYNEPTVWYEFMLDLAKEASDKHLKNVMVTNGYINREPLDELLKYMDAFNVDLKAFNDSFYRRITKSELKPVLRSIQQISESGKHLEITNLVIPTLNDDEEEFRKMVRWIASETGRDTVFHISRYFPNYKMHIASTPRDTLDKFYDIAREYLNYVYLGNVAYDPRKSSTYCSECGSEIIERTGYSTYMTGIDNSGRCKHCGNKVVIQ